MIQHLNKDIVPINEVFFSYQGEGIFAGIPQIFVRFVGCNLRCNYCDTTKSLNIKKSNSKYFTAQALYEYILEIFNKNKNNFYTQKPSISFTGGEPLLYTDFILELTKYLKNKFSIYIETNGTLPQQIKKIYKHCDVVAMDIKFKSACKKDLFDKHKLFIKNCKNKVFLKTVITSSTKKEEFIKAVNLVSSISNKIKFIIQPATFDNITNKKVFEFYSIAISKLKDVRILPQLHKLWKVQ